MAVTGDVNGQPIKVISERLFAFPLRALLVALATLAFWSYPRLSVISAYKAGSTKRAFSCMSRPFSPMRYSDFFIASQQLVDQFDGNGHGTSF
jgi:hypothetical protein